jgi:lysophospholipase L1-like esterase
MTALRAAKEMGRSGLSLHWIKPWDVLTGLTEDQFLGLRRVLTQRWPVCGGFRWPKAEHWRDGVLEMAPPEEVFDGHSVLLVGFRDDPGQPGGGVFLIRNSGRGVHDGALPYAYVRAYMNDGAWIDGPAKRNFDQWEKEIAAFELGDRANPPPRDAVLFVGSSTIARWKTLADDFPDQRVINRGFGGSEIADSTHFAERIIFPYEPRVIVLRAGGNDLHAGRSPEAVFADFKEFVAKVRTRLPEVEILFIALCPSIARWNEAEPTRILNSLVETYARQTPGVRYIDADRLSLGPDGQPRFELFDPDKLHFNAEGYKLLAEKVRPYLAK